MWEDLIAKDAKFSLDDALDFADAGYREDFTRHWGLDATAQPEWLDADEWIAYKRLHGFAQTVARVGTTLLSRKGVGAARLREGEFMLQEAATFERQVQDLLSRTDDPEVRRELASLLETPFLPSDPRTKYALFYNTLQLEVTVAVPYSPRAMAEKLRLLAQHVVATKNARVIEYLSRVARCFLLDMPAEFAVMARAVLDVALKDVIKDDDSVRRKVGAGKHVTLDDRLRFCEALGILDGHTLKGARSVKKAGDDAAHGELEEELDLERLLAGMAKVMTALERFSPKPG